MADMDTKDLPDVPDGYAWYLNEEEQYADLVQQSSGSTLGTVFSAPIEWRKGGGRARMADGVWDAGIRLLDALDLQA